MSADHRAKIIINPEQESRDLGFGAVVSRQQNLRLLNADGSFNVAREKPSLWRALTSYHSLLTMPRGKFLLLLVIAYFLLNALFGAAYLLCGAEGLSGSIGVADSAPFWKAFFFSVHTFATIGYGNVVPVGYAANFVVTLESLVGLLSFALATGLMFARFSRPTADIIYSRNAILAPYRGFTAWEFRIINSRDNQIIELQCKVILSRFEENDGLRQRKFHQLALERNTVAFFPLNWTVVHPIDESSPLFGWSQQRLVESSAEFLILLTGIDETFAQTVHSRSSYTAHEVLWGKRFASLYKEGERLTMVDMKKFHAVEPASLDS